ncbi:MAG: hydrolase TatD [Candidatus Melainabacteria bacterium]|nr:MAG: hydrolase TatD [Candidatus Melainabacteria bacterium]
MFSKNDYLQIKSGIIDSHAHLQLEYCADEPEKCGTADLETLKEGQRQVIQRSLQANVKQIVNPGVDLKSVAELLELAESHEQIYVGLGLHPHNAKDWTEEAEHSLRKAAEHPKVVAIGECGLDFYYNNSSQESQFQALRRQMRLAKELGKPLIIHCRDAFPQLKELLLEEGHGLKGVLHCFTGSPADLSAFEEFDLYVSFSGIVTFPNAKSVQAAATVVRKERLLAETDCPYLAPQKVRGKRNEPAYVWLVAEKLAELRSADLSEIAETCSNNARALFGLPEVK